MKLDLLYVHDRPSQNELMCCGYLATGKCSSVPAAADRNWASDSTAQKKRGKQRYNSSWESMQRSETHELLKKKLFPFTKLCKVDLPEDMWKDICTHVILCGKKQIKSYNVDIWSHLATSCKLNNYHNHKYWKQQTLWSYNTFTFSVLLWLAGWTTELPQFVA